MSRQPARPTLKGSPKAPAYILIALFVELIALYFGFKGMDFLFGACSYSLVPFFIILLLAIFGFVLSLLSTIKLYKTKNRGAMIFGVIATVLCAILGCYGALAASLTFCF
jgi:hypothetical protein